MKIKIITVGRGDKRTGELISEYTSRIEHFSSVEWIYLDHDKTIEKESLKIQEKIKDKDFVVALDKSGREIDTLEFSKFIEKRQNDSSKDLVFIIGGSYGLTKELLDRANFILSMSKFTLPHELARVVLIESIYRGFSIIKNLPYHH